ncbi:unnamed protein product, partial [Heligmosomoides polygyrus]
MEYIIPIVAQLEKEGVTLDGSYLAQKVLAKFSASLQRKTLEGRFSQETKESKERINDMVSKNVNSDETPACMFCFSEHHKSVTCTEYPTTSERRNIMQERKLCLNCGKPGHFIKQCASQGCRTCQGRRHHHTLC